MIKRDHCQRMTQFEPKNVVSPSHKQHFLCNSKEDFGWTRTRRWLYLVKDCMSESWLAYNLTKVTARKSWPFETPSPCCCAQRANTMLDEAWKKQWSGYLKKHAEKLKAFIGKIVSRNRSKPNRGHSFLTSNMAPSIL